MSEPFPNHLHNISSPIDATSPKRTYFVPLRNFASWTNTTLQITSGLQSVKVFIATDVYLDGNVINSTTDLLTFDKAMEFNLRERKTRDHRLFVNLFVWGRKRRARGSMCVHSSAVSRLENEQHTVQKTCICLKKWRILLMYIIVWQSQNGSKWVFKRTYLQQHKNHSILLSEKRLN